MILTHMVDIDKTLKLNKGQGYKLKNHGHLCKAATLQRRQDKKAAQRQPRSPDNQGAITWQTGLIALVALQVPRARRYVLRPVRLFE